MNDPFYANRDIQPEYLGQMMQGNVPEVTKANEVELSEKTSAAPVPSKSEVCKNLKELPDIKNIETKTTDSFNDRLVPVEESFEEKKQCEQEAILRTHFVQTHQDTNLSDLCRKFPTRIIYLRITILISEKNQSCQG